MAEINIQRKKKSVSPWLAVLLVLAVLALVWFFFFRADPEPQPVDTVPPASTAQPLGKAAEEAPEADPVEEMAVNEITPQAFYDFAADTMPSTAHYGRRGLYLLAGVLVGLADRADLRQDAAVQERRNDLTSATSRLEEPGTSLRPGFEATTALLHAMQQAAYPQEASTVARLNQYAAALSGREEADQQPLQQVFFRQAALVLKSFS